MGILAAVKNRFFGTQDEPEKKTRGTYSVLNLEDSKNPQDLLTASEAVKNFHLPFQNKREYYHDMMHPDTQWTPEEKESNREKGKSSIAFSRMPSARRTFLGSIVQQRYDIKPAPTEPTDQSKADVYTALYHATAHNSRAFQKDIGMLSEAWIGGNSWQESYVEITPGRKPRICVVNQNNQAIYPDPNRRDLVTNRDCQFIDRWGWYSLEDLITVHPEQEEMLRQALIQKPSITYTGTKDADRTHETMTERNGQFLVIERFYKVKKRLVFGVSEKGVRTDIGINPSQDQRAQYKSENPGHQVYQEPLEMLYYAACLKGSGAGEYLFNRPHSSQPRNQVTGEIIFPLVELVDEDIAGIPGGHVEHLVGMQRVKNAVVVNVLAQAKNASGQPRVGRSDYFEEDTQQDIEENASNPARIFWTKKNAPNGEPFTLMPNTQLSSEGDKVLNWADSAFNEASSTPPSTQGLDEGNIPASLNAQRKESAAAQSQIQVSNYRNFLTNRAMLWMAYWLQYWDAEEVIRILQKKDESDEDFITINQWIRDEFSGKMVKKNAVQDDVAYDIVFEDSWQSPTVRDKVRQEITTILQSSSVQGDPVLNTMLTYYMLLLSDAPQDMKNFFKKYSQVVQQQTQQEKNFDNTGRQMQEIGQMQNIADREAVASPTPSSMPHQPSGPTPNSGNPAVAAQPPERMAA